ncbi:MAG: ABC transporter ATP-binding protein [Desulfobacterales bacterium]|nr:ABC transporter ATP-binding protein [Desulfobacterales bacterium]
MKIEIQNIGKFYRLPKKKRLSVLKNIDFSIAEGEIVVILGESGCGKSTLLNIMAGLLPPSSGEIRIDGRKIRGPHPSRSIMFQEPSLLPWLNVRENIVFGCKLRGERERLDENVQRLIGLLNLSGFEKAHPSELSVGMAQRVCLARALIGNPRILLLDEPFGSLDAFTRTHLQDELIKSWRREKFTAVFVTHDIEEGIILGDRIALLGGRPCGVIEMFHIDLEHPRDITDEAFIRVKADILARFKESLKR